jgi:regulatory protein
MDLLARREHSELELARKLASRNIGPELVAATVAALVGEGLLDNARFTEAFVHSRYRRGQGPHKIRAELRERGIDDGLIAECLDDHDLQWSGLVEQVRVKRFGPGLPADFKERSRQMRFLQQRGFTSEQINKAFRECD